MAELSEADALAEALSWTSGEMTRWSETAHPDHNRWSWRGDGHGEAFREQFREQARTLIDLGWMASRPVHPAGDERSLLTTPHDGHGPRETCPGCPHPAGDEPRQP